MSRKVKKTIQLTCCICGKTFFRTKSDVNRGRNKFCSKACSGVSVSRKAKMLKEERECLYCGKSFLTGSVNDRKKFCSTLCWSLFNQKKPSIVGEQKECPVCHKYFEVKDKRQKVCSLVCAGKSATPTPYAKRSPRSNPKKIISECKLCGKEFTKKSNIQVYCSPKCRRIYSSITSHRKRSGRSGTVESFRWKNNVHIRDNYTCQKCGSKEKLHAHHIIPFSLDESLRYEITNGITLCEKCHKKEHKRLRKQLGDLQMDFFIVR